LLWTQSIGRNAKITDFEINALNHVIVVGHFTGNISIQGTPLSSINNFDNSVFIMELNENGILQWAHTLNPINGDFKSSDLFLAPNGKMYLTSLVSDTYGFCAFHQLNSLGFITKNEFNNNTENRTFSNVIADSLGNVYLSGTCGNLANFDSIISNPNFSYQNFLVKYDSTFKAKWILSKDYFTFDDNNSLQKVGQKLFWVFNEAGLITSSTKILECSTNGQILNTTNSPNVISSSPLLNFSMASNRNSVLTINDGLKLYLYRYDSNFSITWKDTLTIGFSGFDAGKIIACYDSSFYLAAVYLGNSLQIASFVLSNPNAAANYASDVAVAKWDYSVASNIEPALIKENQISIFPNPAQDFIQIEGSAIRLGNQLMIYDAIGRLIETKNIIHTNDKINISKLNKGIYFLSVQSKGNKSTSITKLIIN
jgi:hypothetical protein